jgi:O-antigen ligase
MQTITAGASVAPRAAADLRLDLADAMRTLARWSLFGLVIASPFRARVELEGRDALLYSDYVDLLLFPSDAFLVGVLLFWILSLALQPRRVWFGPHLVRWPVAGLLLASCISVPQSIDSTLASFNAARTILAASLALYVINEVKGVRELAPWIAVMLVAQAVTGISQVVEQESLGMWRFGEKVLAAGLPGSSIVWTRDEPPLLRAYGLTDHPNVLGGILACAMALIATALSRTRTLWTSLLVVVFALGAVALLLSFSRAAIVGLIAGGALAIALLALRREWDHLALWLTATTAAAVVVAAFIAPYAPYLAARVDPSSEPAGSTEQRSLDERSALAEKTNELFVANPVFGVGAGVTAVAMLEEFPDFTYNHQPAHTVLLDVAAETGVLGAVSYSLLLIGPFVLLVWRRRWLTPELIGVSGALLTLHVLGLFDYYTWLFAAGRIWFWLVLALWVVAYRAATMKEEIARTG